MTTTAVIVHMGKGVGVTIGVHFAINLDMEHLIIEEQHRKREMEHIIQGITETTKKTDGTITKKNNSRLTTLITMIKRTRKY